MSSVGFGSYEIARSGLYVNERGLNTTGQNIANVNTLGYTRQQAIQTNSMFDNYSTRFGLVQIGLGADIQQTRQIRNIFLDNIYRNESTTLGYWQARQNTLTDVQAILADPMQSGLQDVMNQFWDSWQELSKDPSSLTSRALVLQRGQAFVEQANHVGEQIDSLQEDLNTEFKVSIDEFNSITSEIAYYNMKIAENEINYDMANDYRDSRNLLLDRLAKLADVEINEMQDGEVDVTLGGFFVVRNSENQNLVAVDGQGNGLFSTAMLENTSIEVPIKSGTLKGLLESRGEVFASEGSIANGTPSNKADVVVVVDLSDTSASYLDDIKANITSYTDDLIKSGVDYNLRLVTYGTTAGITDDNYGTDIASFLEDINPTLPLIGIETDLTITGNDFGAVSSYLGGITDFREDAGRYALVFTGESIDGDEIDPTPTTDADVADYINSLTANSINTSVITSAANFDAGTGGETLGWSAITEATGGELYDIDSVDYEALMISINQAVAADVNASFSVVPESTNLLSDLKKQLNALVYTIATQVNYLHKSGMTYESTPLQGEDFFTVMDSSRPFEMGNIQINDNLVGDEGLNKVVASLSGYAGDNTIAQAIANLRNENVIRNTNGEVSVDSYYQSIILYIGNAGSEATSIASSQQQLVDSANNSRQSIMGVSMDEEMTNMMKYKFAYDASSRMINTLDEMTKTIIQSMGLVGR